MSPYLPVLLRAAVQEDAGARCGYCLVPQMLVNTIFEVEHLVPTSRGGKTVRDNLWLSCPTCNRFKGDAEQGIDPETNRQVRLFNPRRQAWQRHFRWEGLTVVGLTSTGKATVIALRLNHPLQLTAREFWAEFKVFPFKPHR